MKKAPMATNPRGGGAKGLSGRATEKRAFFAASLMQDIFLAVCFLLGSKINEKYSLLMKLYNQFKQPFFEGKLNIYLNFGIAYRIQM